MSLVTMNFELDLGTLGRQPVEVSFHYTPDRPATQWEPPEYEAFEFASIKLGGVEILKGLVWSTELERSLIQAVYDNKGE